MTAEEILQALGKVTRLCEVTRLRVGEDKCKENCPFVSKKNHRCLFKNEEGLTKTKDEARKELLETLEEYCHDKGYGLQTFAGLSDLVYTLYPLKKTMTNGDWVRSLDDDALAKWLDIFDLDICEDCPKCDDYLCEETLCHSQWQKWVKQEHKENSNE